MLMKMQTYIIDHNINPDKNKEFASLKDTLRSFLHREWRKIIGEVNWRNSVSIYDLQNFANNINSNKNEKGI